jgi:carbonic anhydrase
MFIACSDSRVNPDLITQSQLGDIFVLRNAGGMIPAFNPHIPSGEAATLEFAVSILKIKDIVVCGHSHCGAMSAIAHQTALSNLPALEKWLRHAERTRKIIEKSYHHLSGDQKVMATVQENVLVQLENLRTHPCVIRGLQNQLIRLHGWVFEIETGKVYSYDAEQGQYVFIENNDSHLKPLKKGLSSACDAIK